MYILNIFFCFLLSPTYILRKTRFFLLNKNEMSRRNINQLLENYVFSEDETSDGEQDPRVPHLYDVFPARTGNQYRWWRETCLDCGKKGHLSKYCDRLAKAPRCT